MAENAVILNNVTAHYGTTQVLHGLNLSVGEGELVSLLGSSGCGKTTTLRLLAGFLQPTGGQISVAGRDVTGLPPHKRDAGIVFQNYALFPHLTVAENVGFGLKQRKVAPAERQKRVAGMLERVGLSSFADRLPAALSGGQRQRVAVARALAIDPPLLMFDEPLSNLDAKLRVDMRVEIRELQKANRRTAIYVTHDQEEAFSISDRVAIMNAGNIVQLDTPEVLYTRPVNAFVARFVGFDNLIAMHVVARNGATVTAELAGGERIDLDEGKTGPLPERFVIGARPEGLTLTDAGHDNAIAGKTHMRSYLGRAYKYKIETAAGVLIANGALSTPIEAERNVGLAFDFTHCCILEDEGEAS
ncbi:ABC transporter ATP-binding protein [Martelella mediterranea]|uniref:Maltose/maltodextrin import ATP-binding protein MalK n=1 Tax=Martelella mediterranea DSM 17316 TaxID=1122214 RepID=A0A1U9Z7P9_9HYPH|nr:ABC transporter ATP-binding protein [Martelella mediterranea]AQZ53708.1 Maltose/maltodextrin import ATP-binding protein MalK [Martelella mediterranea DSM 17316]